MSEKTGVENKKSEDEVTLASFIEANHKLITVLGVLTALTIFALNLDFYNLGQLLSLLFLTMVVLVWLELWTKFSFKGEHWRMFWFRTLASMSIIILLFYWIFALTAFREAKFSVLLIVIFGFFAWIMRLINFPFRLMETPPGKYSAVRTIIGLVILLSVALLAVYLADLLSPTIHDFFEAGRNLPTLTPTP